MSVNLRKAIADFTNTFIHKLWLRKNERSVPTYLGRAEQGVRRQRFLESLPIDKVGIRIVGEFQIHRAARSSSSFGFIEFLQALLDALWSLEMQFAQLLAEQVAIEIHCGLRGSHARGDRAT